MKKKSLSARKIIPNNFNFKKVLKDKKIFKIYKYFEDILSNLSNPNKVAIAVSGGSDSMALCFLISCYKHQKNNKIQILFYLVDHGLRKTSTVEAQLVKKHLKLKNINLKILRWKGKKPKSNIQSLARNKRYQLLFNECKKNKIKAILTAHHQDDLYETFFSRLLRGSGIEGLSSFSEIEKTFVFRNSNISIARPLININKDNLTYITRKVFKFYAKDPSNEMEKFQRVRIRKLLTNLKNQGLDFSKLKLTLNNLALANKAINQIVYQNISENVIFSKKKCILKYNFFLQPEEIVFKSLSKLVKKISKTAYPPRGKKMVNLIKELKAKNRLKATLGGTIIEKLHNSVLVSEEKTKKR